ncbi:MAG: nitrogen fixation protein FixH [Aquabacterium sp.]|nr:nitrogen fixation protein FixH [Aquabacterium sp.]
MTTRLAQPLAGTASPASPWWRVGMVWLVLGGPAVVVVASIATAVVAYVGADEVLVNTPSARHAPVQPTGVTPALIARNHAATAANPTANPPADPTAHPAAAATPAPR